MSFSAPAAADYLDPFSGDPVAPRAEHRAEPDDIAPDELSHPAAVMSAYPPRSKYQPLFFLAPVVASMLSMFAGGIPFLTDFAWVLVTVLCVVFLIAELRAFSFRFGIGGLLVFGGTLIWLCYDYLGGWAFDGKHRVLDGFDEEAVARASLAVCVFIPCVLLGIRITFRGVVERTLARLPGPVSPRIWLVMAVVLFVIGLTPYMFFTQEGFFDAYIKDMFAGRSGSGAGWTTGRTGNANYSYGAYLAQVLQVGEMGSILGAYYAIMVARTMRDRVFGFLLWIPNFLQAFGTGTRGAVILMSLPVIGFLFIRFQAEAGAVGKRVSGKGYLYLVGALLVVLTAVQTQIAFRDRGFSNADFENVNVTKVEGNSMFSESLPGFLQIPKHVNPFYSTFPGEAVVRPVFETTFWFFVSPVPRAVWNSKPFDPVYRWYNSLVGGSQDGVEGTTIAQGTVGYWYFRYGMWGPLEGGLIFGFMIGVAERLLQRYWHRPLGILTSLGMMTFFFRAFRNLNWIEFHATMVGIGALCMVYLVVRVFMGDEPQPPLEPT